MNDDLRRAVMRHAGMGELEQLARDAGMRTMYEDGIVKALAGDDDDRGSAARDGGSVSGRSLPARELRLDPSVTLHTSAPSPIPLPNAPLPLQGPQHPRRAARRPDGSRQRRRGRRAPAGAGAPAGRGASWPARAAASRRGGRCSSPSRSPGARLVQFTQQLATLLGAGQPLDRALTILLELPEDEAAQAHHRPTCATRCAAARRCRPRWNASTARSRACTSTWCAPARRAAACTRRCSAWPITWSAAARCAAA